jgi:hypothetical protein
VILRRRKEKTNSVSKEAENSLEMGGLGSMRNMKV